MHFLEVPEATVPPDTVQLARRIRDVASAMLAVPTPAIRWFEAGRHTGGGDWPWESWEGADVAGSSSGYALDEFWLRNGMTARQTVVTVIHELIHLQQFWSRTHKIRTPDELEQLANRDSVALARVWGF